MFRSVLGGLVLAGITLSGFAGSAGVPNNARTLPMTFAVFSEGPTESCAAKCRQLITASGMITSDTPRQFLAFMKDNPPQDGVVVLDSDGGSVLGALEFGRAIRRLGLSTTVGRVIEHRTKSGARFGEINPRVDCQSMCTFVLLAGVKRSVPLEAQVLVHQIWLGDRREDAVAANYTAEDLVVVQRDIGSIVQYTLEMGGDMELVQLSLKAPPWEPMRVLSRDELRRTRLDLGEDNPAKPAATKTAAGPSPADSLRGASHARGWGLDDRSGEAVVSRTHPLTFEGERIGTFDVAFGCADGPGSYTLTYKEVRYGPADHDLPRQLAQVEVMMGDQIQELKIGASERRLQRGELESLATTVISTRLLRRFAADGPASITLATESAGNPQTNIRVGNVGFASSFSKLEASCQQGQWARADHAPQMPSRPEKSATLKTTP
jgi:hypothetical protein